MDGDMKDMGLRPRWQWTERSGGVTSWGERLTRISAEIMDIKRVVVVVFVDYSIISINNLPYSNSKSTSE